MSKKILVVGGFGYLGSVITDILSKNCEVDVCDICLFSNEDVGKNISFLKFIPKIDDVKIDEYDTIIWSATVDISSFYECGKTKDFLNKQVHDFEKLLVKSKKFINCSRFNDPFMNNMMTEYFKDLEAKVKIHSLENADFKGSNIQFYLSLIPS